MSNINQLRECLTPNIEILKSIIAAISPEAENIIRNEGLNQIEAAQQIAIVIHKVTGTSKEDSWDLIFGKGSYRKFMELTYAELKAV